MTLQVPEVPEPEVPEPEAPEPEVREPEVREPEVRNLTSHRLKGLLYNSCIIESIYLPFFFKIADKKLSSIIIIKKDVNNKSFRPKVEKP